MRCPVCGCTLISIHALLAESDTRISTGSPSGGLFLSTLSLRRATALCRSFWRHARNFYPRSPCGERLSLPETPTRVVLFLSTLSLRRATLSYTSLRLYPWYFYPRSPCGERLYQLHIAAAGIRFLSTLSLRRATRCG